MSYKFLSVAFIVFMFCGCSNRQPTTGLNEKGTHTGTLTLLRVDSSWSPDVPVLDEEDNPVAWRPAPTAQRCDQRLGSDSETCDPLRRFVPLRHKDDVTGLDVPENIVLSSQKAVVNLNYAYVKYFQEGKKEDRQGEIAMVLSFDAGEASRDSFLVYSSEGQTLGSFLDFQDWKAIGPVTIDGPALSLRIVIIEVDQVENEQTKHYIRNIAKIASTVAPGVSAVMPIKTAVADFIIGQNKDDVVLDQRFSLTKYENNSRFNASPLLYGKYLILSQEDRLADTGAHQDALFSTLPPIVPEMRYDLDSDRLFKTYTYHTQLFDPEDQSLAPDDYNLSNSVHLPNTGIYYEADNWGPIGWDRLYAPKNSVGDILSSSCVSSKSKKPSSFLPMRNINARRAKAMRQRVLGYPYDGRVDPSIHSCSVNAALARVIIDSVRYTGSSNNGGGVTNEEILQNALSGDDRWFFEYPVIEYPQAQVLLAQYPFHTHIAFSIDRIYGEGGSPYHQAFPEYQAALEAEIEAARSGTEIEKLTERLTQSITAQKKRKAAFKQLNNLADQPGVTAQQKVCVLFNAMVAEDNHAVMGNAEILDEIQIISGRVFTTLPEVEEYLSGDGLNITLTTAADPKGHGCTINT